MSLRYAMLLCGNCGTELRLDEVWDHDVGGTGQWEIVHAASGYAWCPPEDSVGVEVDQ